MPNCLLFVYGLLQPDFQPPRTIKHQWKDAVHGRLFDLGPYPGATDLDQTDSTFEGWVLEIDESELDALDEFEDVTGSAQYRRVRTQTLSGKEVWIYDYIGPIPINAPSLPSWPHRQND